MNLRNKYSPSINKIYMFLGCKHSFSESHWNFVKNYMNKKNLEAKCSSSSFTNSVFTISLTNNIC